MLSQIIEQLMACDRASTTLAMAFIDRKELKARVLKMVMKLEADGKCSSAFERSEMQSVWSELKRLVEN